MLGESGKQLTRQALLGWLRDYFLAGGRISPSCRGRHAKTESFLDDIDLKKEAVAWLMSLKQKSKGGLLMVSDFLSELAGRLRCTKAEAEAYAVSNPDSRIAQLVEEDKAEQGVEARLILEPGGAAGKDNYFDNAQLLTQTKLAMEVFDAMERHRVPPRDVRLPWSADGLNAAPDAVALGPERRLHFVRKVRSKAAAAAGGVAASRVLKCGEPVPARLWGRQKGMQARESADLPVSSLLKQRRWARISWRYAREYRKGTSGHAVLQAVVAQSRHRDTNDRRSRQVEAALEQAEFGL
jgi:hypothetical protein